MEKSNKKDNKANIFLFKSDFSFPYGIFNRKYERRLYSAK